MRNAAVPVVAAVVVAAAVAVVGGIAAPAAAAVAAVVVAPLDAVAASVAAAVAVAVVACSSDLAPVRQQVVLTLRIFGKKHAYRLYQMLQKLMELWSMSQCSKSFNKTECQSSLTVGGGWRDGIGARGDRVLLRVRGRGGAPSAVVSSTRAWIVLAPYTACRACLAHFPGVV